MGLTKLQEATANHVYDVLQTKKEKGIYPSIYLLADEVGLGKTKVAAEVINRLSKDAPFFVVYYLCGNQRVTTQNVRKLIEDCDAIETKDVRLSMQWEYADQYRKSKEKVCILPITPAVTFTNAGSDHEEDEEKSQKRFFDKYGGECKRSDDFCENRETINNYVYSKRLKPNLLILDEFQNYSSLLYPNGLESENYVNEGRERFLKCMRNADYVLLLSATPYEMKSSSVREMNAQPFDDNLDLGNDDSQLETDKLTCSDDSSDESFSVDSINPDFKRLVEFILGSSENLENISDGYDDFIYNNVLCRSERGMFYKNLDKEKEIIEYPSANTLSDILCAQKEHIEYTKGLFETYRNKAKWRYLSGNSTKCLSQFIAFVKECPDVARFSTRYKMLKNQDCDYEFYSKSDYYKNGLFDETENVCQKHFGLNVVSSRIGIGDEDSVFKMLWIPPTVFRTKCTENNPFWENRDYTKSIIFGNYRLSTASIAFYLSKEVKRRRAEFVNSFFAEKNTCHVEIDADHIKDEVWIPNELIKVPANDGRAACIRELRDLIKEYLRMNIDLIRAVTGEVADCQKAIGKYAELGDLWHVVDEYAMICGLYDSKMKLSRQKHLLYNFQNMRLYFSKMVDGTKSLGATKVIVFDYDDVRKHDIDNFLFASKNKMQNGKTDESIKESIDTAFKKLFQKDCGFCERFTDDNTDCNAHIKRHQSVLQELFNSPFYPFAMASTSVAQEGLDFHNYCHRIVHWSVAKTPISFEQREGRIDRYMSHLVRKRLQNDYSDCETWSGDNGIMSCAERDKEDLKPLFPYWYVEPNEKSPKFIRIICAIPNSREGTYYAKLKTALKNYNYYLGPSRNEMNHTSHNYCPLYVDELERKQGK